MAEAGRSIWTDQSGDGDRGQGQIGATRTYQPVRKYIDALMQCLHDLRVNFFFFPHFLFEYLHFFSGCRYRPETAGDLCESGQ